MQLSRPGTYHVNCNVIVYPAAYELEPDRDYEIHPLTNSFREMYNL